MNSGSSALFVAPLHYKVTMIGHPNKDAFLFVLRWKMTGKRNSSCPVG
jgi:hypothetical protein